MISIMLGDEQKTILSEPKSPLSVETFVVDLTDTNTTIMQSKGSEFQRGDGLGAIGPRTADMGVL